MKTSQIVLLILLSIISIYYLIYTIRFTILLRKDTFYTGWKRRFHFIMIWVVPFIWIQLLKILQKPIHGSDKFVKQRDTKGFEDNMIGTTILADDK